MDILFYEWFLRELIEALQRLDLSSDTSAQATRVTNAGPGQHAHATGAGPVVTRRQSNLQARPRTRSEIVMVDGEAWTLGDGTRYRPILMQTAKPSAIAVSALPPWLPPWPIMPPQAKGTSVAWDGPNHAAHVHDVAGDGLFDHPGYVRDDGAPFTAPVMGTTVEVTGVFATPTMRRCNADWRTHPEHLAFASSRYNMRLPVMAGVDPNGRYLRVARLPLKTFEFRPLSNDEGNGGGGIPT